MTVALGGDDAPQLRDGSPAIPLGSRQPARGDTVFVDTSVIIGGDDSRLPLLLLAFAEQLDICWSPYVAAEVARVATREQALETLQRGGGLSEIRRDLETRRDAIDRVIADHERYWRAPAPDAIRAAIREHSPLPVVDSKDHPILAAALAVEASFLLTTNSTDFPHGASHAGVTYWHPDTFLTAFFMSHPLAYEFVREEYEAFAADMGAQLRP